MTDAPDGRTSPIQAPKYTERLDDTHTELARAVAAGFRWVVDESDRIFDTNRQQVGSSLVRLGEVMRDAGWFTTRTNGTLSGVAWSLVPGDELTAATYLLSNGSTARPS